MASYDSPNINNIPFKFTSGGYTKPPFDAVPFRFGLRPSYTQTSDLQAAINVIEVRDLSASIVGELWHFVNLFVYLKSTIQAYKNLGAYIKPLNLNTKDLSSILTGKLLASNVNLLASIYSIAPIDLPATLNVISIEDLSAYINGVLFSGQFDLNAAVNKVFQSAIKNLTACITGELEFIPFDLGGSIYPFCIKDLLGIVGSFDYRGLTAYLNSISPVDISSSIHGYDMRFLPAILNGVYGPYDIQASIYGVASKNLSAFIDVYKGIEVPFNLRAIIEGYYYRDLSSSVFPISAVDLQAFINSSGKSDYLIGTIIPKVVHIKRALNISLLNHKDLSAAINFSCFYSNYKDLSAYTYAIQKLDLRSFILGVTSTGDNVVNLGALINTGIAEAHDAFTIKYLPSNDSITLDISMILSRRYYVYDTLLIKYGLHDNLDLGASITSILTNKDLSAYINPMTNVNFSQLPPGRRTKMHETVINLAKGETQWQREAEILFSSSVSKYFYVGGNQNIYRFDRDDHWVIRVEGYEKLEGSGVERGKNRTKYIFKLSEYDSVDAAIRNIIDRVTSFRRADLSASLTCVGSYENLFARVVVMRTFKSRRNITGYINGIT